MLQFHKHQMNVIQLLHWLSVWFPKTNYKCICHLSYEESHDIVCVYIWGGGEYTVSNSEAKKQLPIN